MGTGCDPCNSTGGSSYLPPAGPTCSNPTKNTGPVDSSCVKYTGPNLNCLDVETNSWLEDILIQIDARVCQAGGDAWDTYDYHCLDNEASISTAGEFVDAMTSAYCTLQTAYNTFTTATFPSTVNNLQSQINQINNPGLSLCAGSGITPSDTYTSILNKLATQVCNLQTAVNVSSANWNQCFSTTPLPTTIVQGFNILIDQICNIINNPVTFTLPTFNNQGSCLPPPLGTADSLVLTINKIKTRLCTLGTYDIDYSPWGCVPNPAPGTGANVQAAVNALVGEVNNLKVDTTTFDPAKFVVTYNNPGDACSGRYISLSPTIASDRLVASDSSDMNPGTLSEKLTAGNNIVLDNTSTPGQLIISAANNTDEKVKAYSGDPSAGFLIDKIDAKDNVPKGFTLTESVNPTTNKVEIFPDFNDVTFVNYLFDTIENNSSLYTRFCNLICGCEPCGKGTTTTSSAVARVAVRVINSTDTDMSIKTEVNQNSPVYGLVNTGLYLTPSQVYDSGFYTLTTPFLPLLTTISLTNTSYDSIDVTISVIYPNNVPVPGSSSVTTTLTNGVPYINNSFNIGSTYSDVIILIRITSYV